jgi:ubiquinone/menaquinone biosynthesis C-methylase UbiE
MSDRFTEIYANRAADYHRLVSAEDCDRKLAHLVASWVDARTNAIEVGAGTGRVTRMLAEGGARVLAYEASEAMLTVARAELADHRDRVELSVADARSLPCADGLADLAIAGWVFGHFRAWYPKRWHIEIARAVSELDRVTRSGGRLVIIETFGTMTDGPSPPGELLEYYAWLQAIGFERTVLSTDYLFSSPEEAAEIAGFFFGDAVGARVRAGGSARIPEWTGVFVRSRS